MCKPLCRILGQASLPVVASILLLFSSTAYASGEDAGAKAKEKDARKACLAGDSAKGAALLAELFVDTNDYNYIFNQARCFEQNHRYEDAISRFREYLKKAPNVSADDRADVEKEIAECQGFLQPSTSAPKPAPEAAVPPPASAVAPLVVPPSPPNSSPLLAPAASVAEANTPSPAVTTTASPGAGLRVAGITCGAAGLLAIGTAIYFSTRVTSLSDKISTSDTPSASDYQSGKNAQTIQWVFYGVGAAAVGTGSVLYYLGWRASETGRTAFAPMIGPDIAGLSAKGAF